MTTPSNTTTTKICKRCNEGKQITEFYSDSRGGYLSRCKPFHADWVCERGKTKAKPASKKCGEVKVAEQFYETVDRRLFGCCKTCEAEKRAENPEPHTQRDRCGACRNPLNGKGHADHIIALANGGSNWPSNIQLLCPPCNGKKRDKDPIVFMQEMGYLL